jgi:5-methylcytosine-specific restriction protein A
MSPAPSVCSTPRCFELAVKGKCEDCKRADRKRSALRRSSNSERGYDSRWRRTASRFLKSHPWCSEPDCDEHATVVDHIDGLGPNGPNGHKWVNLRGFCKRHHDQRTARDQPGGWNG